MGESHQLKGRAPAIWHSALIDGVGAGILGGDGGTSFKPFLRGSLRFVPNVCEGVCGSEGVMSEASHYGKKSPFSVGSHVRAL